MLASVAVARRYADQAAAALAPLEAARLGQPGRRLAGHAWPTTCSTPSTSTSTSRLSRTTGAAGYESGPASGRRVGKRITSRMASAPLSSIASRSMPIPSPAVGGRPYSSARR